MRASGEAGGNGLLQCSQVGRSSSMTDLRRVGLVDGVFYVFKPHGSMVMWSNGNAAGGRDEGRKWPVAPP